MSTSKNLILPYNLSMKQLLFLGLLYLLTIPFAEARLIGGNLADKNSYRSTVYNGSCTGTKIGPKTLLFAAHCFLDSDTRRLKTQYSNNARFILETHYGVFYPVTVENVYTHPTYAAELIRLARVRQSDFSVGSGSYDVAIMKIKEETPSIPVGTIDYSPSEIGDDVIIGGYGCEDTATILSKTKGHRFKVAAVKVEPDPQISRVQGQNSANMYRFNFFTTGIKKDARAASICPGDSGGPVYRNRKVIGVNATYLFLDRSGVAQYNAHARLADIKDWIESIPQ